MWSPLDQVLLLCLMAVLVGAENWVEFAKFGMKKLELLRRFRSYENDTLSHDQQAACSRCSMPSSSSAASLPGSAHLPSPAPTSSP
jgi:hypothetical protein